MATSEQHVSSILGRLQAGLMDRSQFHQHVIDQVYAGLHRFCEIPAGYRHCDLATRQVELDGLEDGELRTLLDNPPPEILNPHPSQVRAVTLFEMLLSGNELVTDGGDPLNPAIGAYLYGPPGTGKTHLMAAFGRRIKKLLDARLANARDTMSAFVDDAYLKFNQRIASELNTDDAIGYARFDDGDIRVELSPEDEFWQRIDTLKQRLSADEYQPTDLIYIGFKELFEVCKHSPQRRDAMAALESAKVVFIDDIHPQGDPEQVRLVLHLLERRYEMGRPGTFLTTNLPTRELGGGDEMLGNRLMSRCAETLLTIDFSDCDDWRQTVKSKRIKLVEQEIDRMAKSHRHRDP